MEVGMSTLSKKGQITIPKDARKRLGVSVGDRVLFKIEGEQVVLVRIKERRLSETLDAQEPWPIDSLRHQRRLRNEWVSGFA
jgi:AbrB family looped-hinge helix DNA binding protein